MNNNNPKSPKEEIFTPQFKELHDKTIRRRQNLQQNKMELERRLALITAKLANLTMDRDAHNCGFLRDQICTPMSKAAERIALEQEYGSSPYDVGKKHWLSLTSKLSQLETDVARQVQPYMS